MFSASLRRKERVQSAEGGFRKAKEVWTKRFSQSRHIKVRPSVVSKGVIGGEEFFDHVGRVVDAAVIVSLELQRRRSDQRKGMGMERRKEEEEEKEERERARRVVDENRLTFKKKVVS